MTPITEQLSYLLEETYDNLLYQPYYWKRVGVVWRSWCFRMFTLTDSDLEDKVPKNNLGIHSTFCDKSNWTHSEGATNFWNVLNEGHRDMTMEFFGRD